MKYIKRSPANKILTTIAGISFIVACSGKKNIVTDHHTTHSDSIVTNENPRVSHDFEKFLNFFMVTTFYEKKFDSLLAISDSSITQFIHKGIGFGRYFNAGAFCNLYRNKNDLYGYSDNNFGDPLKTTRFPVFAKEPIEGFCEEAKSDDGIYYFPVEEFPDAWDMEKDKVVKVILPEKYESVPKMKVTIISKKWVVNQFYFIQVDTIWYFAFSNDCDCSI